MNHPLYGFHPRWIVEEVEKMSYESDCELLGLDPEEFPHDPAEIKTAFRALCFRRHPDHGGDRDRFEALREAYDRLYHHAVVEYAKCKWCVGGTVDITVGFTSMKEVCPMCAGTGKRGPKKV